MQVLWHCFHLSSKKSANIDIQIRLKHKPNHFPGYVSFEGTIETLPFGCEVAWLPLYYELTVWVSDKSEFLECRALDRPLSHQETRFRMHRLLVFDRFEKSDSDQSCLSNVLIRYRLNGAEEYWIPPKLLVLSTMSAGGTFDWHDHL